MHENAGIGSLGAGTAIAVSRGPETELRFSTRAVCAFMAEPFLQSKMSHSFKRSEPSHIESLHVRDAS